ncbi:MAG TPA: dienelactone hydrolase family protein [Candidatus Nanopelagicales bacterium]|nr:dienelactone hydrolase family protein [Candidatus Nanopelagicales bacterium]
MGDLLVPLPDGRMMPAYFASAGDEPAPGVVVVHEIFGLNDDIRDIADQFAARGFHAVAPDLLGLGNRVRCLVSVARSLSSGEGPAVDAVHAARRWLAERADCTGRMGIAGFCLGGGFAIVMADKGFEASSVNYGRLPKDLDAALAGSCAMVASYGGRDGSLKGAAETLRSALERNGVEHDVKEYAEAGHSFMNHSAETAPAWLKAFNGSLHAGYVDTAATDAWDRMTRLFDSALR